MSDIQQHAITACRDWVASFDVDMSLYTDGQVDGFEIHDNGSSSMQVSFNLKSDPFRVIVIEHVSYLADGSLYEMYSPRLEHE